MKVSHIIYKVNNLKEAVESFTNMGFKVEYGSRDKPHNALIYFSQGPYIELLDNIIIPIYTRTLLRLLGKRKILDRIDEWRSQKEGFFEICLENKSNHFRHEKTVLKKHGIDYFITKSKRIDPLDRALEWKLLFPFELRLPFFMTPFNTSPKPINFTHPNGVKGIERLSYGTADHLISIVKELCDDQILNLYNGKGVKDIIYKK